MKNNTVTQADIDKLIEEAHVHSATYFEKTTVVTVQLKSGFVIVESSSCVDPANYNFELGKEICMERVKNKLWELEGYVLQKKVAESK